jgi:hypothetical protein
MTTATMIMTAAYGNDDGSARQWATMAEKDVSNDVGDNNVGVDGGHWRE